MNNTQNNKATYIVGGIVLGILLALLLSPVFGRGGYSGMMNWGNNSVSGPSTMGVNSIDEHFIEQMIPHHEGAVAMANLALKNAKHSEIKTLASAIIDAQTKEIKNMRTWYSSWFGKDVSNEDASSTGGGMMSVGGMHMGGQEDMTALEKSPDFDKAFIEQMIPHHQLAIMMAQMLESGTNRPEMLQLAKNIIGSQSQEIQQMQGWYNVWYK